jgi:hypothetical protein
MLIKLQCTFVSVPTTSPSAGDVPLSSTVPASAPVLADPEVLPNGKHKKGTIFKCETCSKVRHLAPFFPPRITVSPEGLAFCFWNYISVCGCVCRLFIGRLLNVCGFGQVYRHPNCLVKHRWEHSPHWREASKFLLSKHQQVQMLEVRVWLCLEIHI